MIDLDDIKTNMHDSILWAMRLDDRLYFDIDAHIDSKEKNGRVFNTIVPVTLQFDDVENLVINLNCEWVNGLEIDMVKINHDMSVMSVMLLFQEGSITFSCKNYKYHLKGEALETNKTCLSEEERGGYNFNMI